MVDLKEAGKIIHRTKSGSYVIEAKAKVLPQTLLYDSSGKKVARVVDLIGPIDKPFIVAKPLIQKPEKRVKATLYFSKEKRRKE